MKLAKTICLSLIGLIAVLFVYMFVVASTGNYIQYHKVFSVCLIVFGSLFYTVIFTVLIVRFIKNIRNSQQQTKNYGYTPENDSSSKFRIIVYLRYMSFCKQFRQQFTRFKKPSDAGYESNNSNNNTDSLFIHNGDIINEPSTKSKQKPEYQWVIFILLSQAEISALAPGPPSSDIAIPVKTFESGHSLAMFLRTFCSPPPP
jgi:hypothetical protein